MALHSFPDPPMPLAPPPRRILLVEDTADHAALIQIAFSHLDETVRIRRVSSAEEGIALLDSVYRDLDHRRGEVPHLVLLDINMPGIGGYGFLEWRQSHALAASIPVVVVTSAGDPRTAKRCLALGAQAFLEKPPDFFELVPAVWEAMGWEGAEPTTGWA